jgi:type IV fimbrial biogenesis protein FimT
MERQLHMLGYQAGGRVLNLPRSQRGASLIEVMIGLTLAGILLAMGIPSFQSGMQNRQIRSTAEAIQSGLHLARTEALRRNRPVKFELQGGNGWRIGCDPADATLVDGQPACPDMLQTRDGAEGGRHAEVARVTVSATSGTDSGSFEELRFTPLGRVTTLNAANNAVFRVSNPKGGSCFASGGEMRCLSVVVTSAGQIRMCDPALSPPDTRAC